ncbi:MAG: SH3 domain-containing protein, partial [Dehalococcoidia bacterium]|nr:SH3 domain-containing protein [Dehalococcoidia bacterium]
SESTGVFHGPRESGEPRFRLDAGSEVRLLEARGAWWKIGIFDSGVEGWIAGADAETVLSDRG